MTIEELFRKEIEKEGVLDKANFDKDLAFESMLKEFDKIVEKNKSVSDKESKITRNKNIYEIRKDKGESKFEVAKYTVPGLNYSDNKQYSKSYQTLVASFNAAKNFEYTIGNTSKDNATSLTYQALTRLFLTYRFLEIFKRLIYQIEGIEYNETEDSSIYINDNREDMFQEFLKEAEKVDLTELKKITFDTLKYLDKKKNREFGAYEEGKFPPRYYRVNHAGEKYLNLRSKNVEILKDIRDLFVHSVISASSGTGKPYYLFVLSNTLSNLYLEEAEKFFDKRIVEYLFEKN